MTHRDCTLLRELGGTLLDVDACLFSACVCLRCSKVCRRWLQSLAHSAEERSETTPGGHIPTLCTGPWRGSCSLWNSLQKIQVMFSCVVSEQYTMLVNEELPKVLCYYEVRSTYNVLLVNSMQRWWTKYVGCCQDVRIIANYMWSGFRYILISIQSNKQFWLVWYYIRV